MPALWELCGDPARARQLESYFHALIARRIIENPVFFTGVSEGTREYPGLMLAVDEGYKIISGGDNFDEDKTAEAYGRFAGKAAEISGWVGFGKNWIGDSTTTMTAYSIGVKPGKPDVLQHVSLKTVAFVGKGPLTVGMDRPSASVRTHSGYSLTGGGAVSPNRFVLLTGSLCEPANDGGGEMLWSVFGKAHGWHCDSPVHGFAIGLKVSMK